MMRRFLASVQVILASVLTAVAASDLFEDLDSISQPITFSSGIGDVQCMLANNLTEGASCGVVNDAGFNSSSSGLQIELAVPLPRYPEAVQVLIPGQELKADKNYTLGFWAYGWPLSPFQIHAVNADNEIVATQKAALYAGWSQKYMAFTPNKTDTYSFILNGFGNNIIVMTDMKTKYQLDNITLYEGAPPPPVIGFVSDTPSSSFSSSVTSDFSYTSVGSDGSSSSKSGSSKSSSSKSKVVTSLTADEP